MSRLDELKIEILKFCPATLVHLVDEFEDEVKKQAQVGMTKEVVHPFDIFRHLTASPDPNYFKDFDVGDVFKIAPEIKK